MLVIFGEREKNPTAKYQKGAVDLEGGESIQLDFCGLIITNFSRHKMYVVSSNNKLSPTMKTKIPLNDDEDDNGPTGLLN